MAEIDADEQIRDVVRQLCGNFPGEYWRELDAERACPTTFVRAKTEAGFLGALIPEEYGGSGVRGLESTAMRCELNSGDSDEAACH